MDPMDAAREIAARAWSRGEKPERWTPDRVRSLLSSRVAPAFRLNVCHCGADFTRFHELTPHNLIAECGDECGRYIVARTRAELMQKWNAPKEGA